jgi:hypothetical protein
MLKIHIIKKIDNDINILNTLDNDIDILLINKIDLTMYEQRYNFRLAYDYEKYVNNIFKNVNLPITLKHLIIQDFILNEIFLDVKETFLTDIFSNLKLPFNCVIDAKYSEEIFYRERYEIKNVRYYSSLNNKEEKFEICKNNIPLMNRNEKFYNEYYKYVKKE